jgi:hypothetical protein
MNQLTTSICHIKAECPNVSSVRSILRSRSSYRTVLHSKMTELIDKLDFINSDCTKFRIAVIGREGVGKSTLIARMFGMDPVGLVVLFERFGSDFVRMCLLKRLDTSTGAGATWSFRCARAQMPPSLYLFAASYLPAFLREVNMTSVMESLQRTIQGLCTPLFCHPL